MNPKVQLLACSEDTPPWLLHLRRHSSYLNFLKNCNMGESLDFFFLYDFKAEIDKISFHPNMEFIIIKS